MAILENIDARGMRHCETTALGVLLKHAGLDLSEPMLFGLGSGLSFIYWDAKGMDLPLLGGRVKPFELTKNLSTTLGLALSVAETSSARKAWHNVAAPIDSGRPVGLQLDSYHLDYFTTKVHFGGHVVAMYGYDDDHAYLVDTEQQGGAVRTALDSLALARSERGPMTAKNRSFTITVPPAVSWQAGIVPAIRSCATAFLAAPIANLGHRGIEKAAGQVRKWMSRTGDPRRHLPHVALLMERGGTGGALFRNLYRDFLGECADHVESGEIRTAHRLYGEAAALWTDVAALIAKAGETGEAGDDAYLNQAGDLLLDLARIEKDAMLTLSSI
ncbi:lantibiotic ABC transporter [Spongiactinospora gelatinilytica]|uniref:Lantibiotic ABC transporter n=1 Tax=Spongiactinospora gelatinilytica TaxID=2666298 RepID=A0A2W2FU78_9ACTN|nr:BtrH N-terminal domain-containing protein [Spongiactinospora gelatinilytica]PZG40996.1 lantibiotic ABC transporter [Spongiactinospora gelatinilytica]